MWSINTSYRTVKNKLQDLSLVKLEGCAHKVDEELADKGMQWHMIKYQNKQTFIASPIAFLPWDNKLVPWEVLRESSP